MVCERQESGEMETERNMDHHTFTHSLTQTHRHRQTRTHTGTPLTHSHRLGHTYAEKRENKTKRFNKNQASEKESSIYKNIEREIEKKDVRSYRRFLPREKITQQRNLYRSN